MVHVPAPAVIVTVFPLIEQALVAVMVGVMPEFEVVSTVKLDWYAAVAGAPAKETVGEILPEAVVVSVTAGAAR
jgi:hypothetical protein